MINNPAEVEVGSPNLFGEAQQQRAPVLDPRDLYHAVANQNTRMMEHRAEMQHSEADMAQLHYLDVIQLQTTLQQVEDFLKGELESCEE